MTQTIDNPGTRAGMASLVQLPVKTRRSWKTWEFLTAAAAGLLIGGAAGWASGDSKLESRLASAKSEAAQQVEAKIEAEFAARKAELDRREAVVSEKEAARKARTFADGVYQVGVDIVPGIYATAGGDRCYWEKTTGGSGIDNVIDTESVSGPVVVTVEPSVKFFKSSHCGTWTKR